ncbi:MAG: hypothetical protein KIT60_04480 [Burkholderiaceae bacterium]|nr:hypothetical protein [Burkholderiaceae bacterium]
MPRPSPAIWISMWRPRRISFSTISPARRSRFESEMPMMTDLGLSGFDLYAWYGLLAPAGTPPDVIQTLARVTTEITASADLRDLFAKLGMEPMTGGTYRFAEYLRAEATKWGRIVKLSGANAE